MSEGPDVALREPALQRWWPTTQSLDLVEGPFEEVARAVDAEVSRFLRGQPLVRSRERFRDLDAAFGAAPDFTNGSTFFLVLPTHSRWTVLWNNSFLCDGYDSLCRGLTHNQGLTTIHWSASDEPTVFLAGTLFVARRKVAGGEVAERSVYCCDQRGRWSFHASGEALPEEDTSAYAARRKRDRLSERSMLALLERLGARPWSEAFYALAEQDCFTIARTNLPATIVHKSRQEVLRAR